MSLEQEIIELKQIVAKHEELYKAIVNALSAHEVVSNLAANLDKVFEAAKPIEKASSDAGEDWGDCDDDDEKPVKKAAPKAKVSKSSEDVNPVDFIGECATDDDLDSTYGDPTVFVEPRDWTGEPWKCKEYSECTADYLLKLAKLMDWLASDNKKKNALASNGKPKYMYNEIDAKRARGWAKRKMNVSGEVPQQTKSSFDDEDYKF